MKHTNAELEGSQLSYLSKMLKQLQDFKLPTCIRCDEPTVKSHTISRNVLERIADDKKRVVELRNQLRDGTFELKDDLRAISKFSLFRALCNKHDQDFAPADKVDLNHLFTNLYEKGRMEEPEMKSVFLWSYRAVLRELYAQMFIYQMMSKVLRSPEIPYGIKLGAQVQLAGSIIYTYYAHRWHQLFAEEKWDGVTIRCLRLVGASSVAASGLFSLDAVVPFREGRVAVTVVPSPAQETTIVFYTSLPEDADDLDRYLKESGVFWVPNISMEERRQAISSQLLRDVECFAVSPAFWKEIPLETREAMLQYFYKTAFPGGVPLSKNSRQPFNLFAEASVSSS